MTEEEKLELTRLAWKAGFHAQTPAKMERVLRALRLAVGEGWAAEDEAEVCDRAAYIV